jgi:predicted nucleic acid-binding protein
MIIDTNVVVSILMEPTAAKDEFVLKHKLIAPQLLKMELINVLRKYHFFNSIPMAKAINYYENGLDLFASFVDNEPLLASATELSFKLNHPIYDCLYLALAIQLEQPFVSIDKKLLQKAGTLGIVTIDFDSI